MNLQQTLKDLANETGPFSEDIRVECLTNVTDTLRGTFFREDLTDYQVVYILTSVAEYLSKYALEICTEIKNRDRKEGML